MIEDSMQEYFSKVITLFDQSTNYEQANDIFMELTRISSFFSSQEELLEFKNYLILMESQNKFSKISSEGSEWADVQTPPKLVTKVLDLLARTGFQPSVIIEPTYGDGNFILQATEYFPEVSLIYGVEIQRERKWNFGINALLHRYSEKPISELEIEIHTENIFTHNFENLVSTLDDTPILIIGNPPWITNAELGSIKSDNLPRKSNKKKFTGLDALTGKSNFDIAESIIQRMIDIFSNCSGKIAFLCKNTVIKNITKELRNSENKIGNLQAYQFDATKEFGKACNASLFVLDINVTSKDKWCSVYNLDQPKKLVKKFGWVNQKFVSDIAKYNLVRNFDGKSNYIWRQGIKHDCSKILELSFNKKNQLLNKLGEIVDIEDELLYPLLKGSNLRQFEIKDSKRKIVLTQSKLNEDTAQIELHAPLTWQYLNNNIHFFNKRKSSIYKNKKLFSIFGIGEYAFKPYKVAIAGMYKSAFFSLIQPIDKKPVMLDDTCYYLSFDSYENALFVCTALNSNFSLDLLDAIAFQDSKRPYTKEILMRIQIQKILEKLTFTDLLSIWKNHNFSKIDNYDEEKFAKVKGSI